MILEGKVSLYHFKSLSKNQLNKSQKFSNSMMNAGLVHNFLKDGNKIEVFDQLYLLQEFTENSYIGEIEIFGKSRRTTYAVATRETHTMVLSKIDLETIVLTEYPHIYSELKKLSNQRHVHRETLIKEVENFIRLTSRITNSDMDLVNKSAETLSSVDNTNCYREVTPLQLYKESITRYPIEDLINEQGTEVKDLTFEEIFNSKEENTTILLKYLQGSFEVTLECKEEFFLRKQEEENTKYKFKQEINKVSDKINEISASNKSLAKLTPESTALKKNMHQQMVNLNKSLDEMKSIVLQNRSDLFQIDKKLDFIKERIQSNLMFGTSTK